MNINYTDRVKKWDEGFPLVQQATNRLQEILGEDAGLVTGEWDRTEDEKGRTLLTLRLKDATGEVVGKIELDELRSRAETSFRLHSLWGDLLHAQNVKRLKDLNGTGD
jgi:hypothetical protein